MRTACCVLSFLLASPLVAQAFNGRTATEWVKDLAAADPTTRDYAVWALVTMGDRAVRPALRALDDERPAVREHAAVALGRLGATASAGAGRLLELQQDAVPAVAKAAAVAAMRVQVDAARMPQLVAALRGDDWDLQLAAADVLAALGPAATAAAQPLVDLLRRDARALDRTIVLALPTAQTQHWNVREAAALALGAIGPVAGVPIAAALRDTLTNREWAARQGALHALAAFPGDAETVTGVLTVLVGDEVWSCRRAAAEVLATLVPADSAMIAKAVGVARLALRDDDGGVRRLAAEFLGGVGASAASAVPELLQLLGSRSQDDRGYAIAALRGIGPAASGAKDALVACYEALPAAEEWRRQEVLEALAAVAPAARKELPDLEQLLAAREKPSPSPDVKRHEAIVEALSGLQHASAERRQRALGEIAQLRAVEAIPHLLPWLDGERDARERAAAVAVLMALDAEAALPKMRALLADDSAAVRRTAAQALAMWNDAASLPRVAEVLAEGIEQAGKDQLVYLGLTGVAALAPALERIVADGKQAARRRWGATQALGALGVPAAAKVVAAMVDGLAADASLRERDRQELLVVGLRVLAALDAAAHRPQFERHAKADEQEVRDAALAGLARLGDAEAKAELRRRSPWQAIDFDVPDALRPRLEGARLRLSQVRGNTLREVIVLLEKALGMPITVSAKVDPQVLGGRFQGGYINLLGLRPQALAVLGVVNGDFFSGGTLVPRFLTDRIELVTPEEAGMTGRR